MCLFLVAAAALAAEPILDRPVPPYPQELSARQTSVRWERADVYGHRLGVMGGVLAVGGAAGVGLGTTMILLGADSEAVGNVGGVTQTTSLVPMLVGPPMLLGGAMRSARSMRKRGARVPTLAGGMGWVLYSTTPIFLAMFNRGFDGTGATDQGALPILSFGGSIALGFLQQDVNRRYRSRTGLPWQLASTQ